MINQYNLKYLWVYSAANEWTISWHEKNRIRRMERGYDIQYFLNTPLSLQNRWLPFEELDHLWRIGYKPLMRMYEELARKIEGRDVLVLYNGANLHPDFIASFKNVLKVYTFGDPESSAVLAQPISPYFDIHLVNQMSEIEKFRSWGLKHVYFWPLGSLNSEDDVNDLEREEILNIQQRSFQATLFCEYNLWRSKRLDKLKDAFPNAFFAGKGWDIGYVPWEKMWDIYRKTQIGWNIHNTTGFNFRTYDLLSFGVMQICDNKSDLEKILIPGKEVVGFDTIEECIELSKYYIEHPNEQREIALAGWERWKKHYTPDRVWDKLVEIVELNLAHTDNLNKGGDSRSIIIELNNHKKRSFFFNFLSLLFNKSNFLFQKFLNFFRRIYKKITLR